MGPLTELKPTKNRQPAMIKAASGGLVEKAVVVGGGVAIAYTFAATLPVASLAAVVAIGAYLWDEVKTFRTKDNAEELAAILAAKTPKHPSIQELRSQLKAQYPTEAINQAIESMLGHTELVHFAAKDPHPLAPFGSVYCWINPEDPGDVKLPLQRLEELFASWDLIPAVEAVASPVFPHHSQESTSPAPSMAATQGHLGQNSAAAELLDRLDAEVPDLLLLVKAPPIRLVGLQRTGKSTFAQKLTLLRMVLLQGHTAAWATPHRELDNPVPAILMPTGYTTTGAKDYAAIEALWLTTQNRINQGQTLNQTVVWDEFGGYDAFSDLELLKGSLRSMLREASKFSYHPILIAHGDQGAFYPGIANIVTTVRNSTIKVVTHGEPIDRFGTMRPTGRVTITWLDGRTTELTWPDWLTADYLLSMLQRPPEKPVSPVVVEAAPVVADAEIEGHSGEEVHSKDDSQDDQVAFKVATKLMAKLEASNGQWVSIRDLSINLVSQVEEREIALKLVQQMIDNYQLETMDKENPNRTISYFVRLKQGGLANSDKPN